ncbi:MAG: Na+/H+ antiporter NhaA [Marmoricola sp.]
MAPGSLGARGLRLLSSPDPHESSFLGRMLRSETVGGVLALVAAATALLWANLAGHGYEAFRDLGVGPLDLAHWASDGGLALFFFVAGLELKRELLVGSLRRPADAVVPVVAAFCGVAVPVAVYLVANRGTANLHGWAIPAATDIAFALAVLAVVGSGLPTQLRAFLLTLAVVDDLIVIVIIALAYSGRLQPWYGVAALALAAAYAVCQRLRVHTPAVHLALAVAAWWCVHESGVHATVCGVVLALLTRVLPDPEEAHSPAERLEHRLSPLSALVAVPFFALTSAGVRIAADGQLWRDPLVWGVVLGLCLGKPVGVLGGTWLVTRFTRATLDPAVRWRDLAGVAVLAGVGFTVALLVSDLSFAGVRSEHARTGVLLASVLAALAAATVLRFTGRDRRRSGRDTTSDRR